MYEAYKACQKYINKEGTDFQALRKELLNILPDNQDEIKKFTDDQLEQLCDFWKNMHKRSKQEQKQEQEQEQEQQSKQRKQQNRESDKQTTQSKQKKQGQESDRQRYLHGIKNQTDNIIRYTTRRDNISTKKRSVPTPHTLDIFRWPARRSSKKYSDIPNLTWNESIYKWSFWQHINQTTQIDYQKDYTSKDYQFFDDKFFGSLYQNVVKLYQELYDYDAWFDDYPVNLLKYDKTFAQKVEISEKSSKIVIIGDIHSSLHSLLDIINDLQKKDFFKGDSLKLRKNQYIFFLGDLVDRGPYSLEIIAFVFLLKLENPRNVYIVNGNHEDAETYTHFDLSNEYQNQIDPVFMGYLNILHYLPTVIYLNFDDSIYHLSHGAFDYEYARKELMGFLKSSEELGLIWSSNVQNGDLNQYKWGDLYQNVSGYHPFGGRDVFGSDIVNAYLDKYGIVAMFTGHQDFESLNLMLTDEVWTNVLNGQDTRFKESIAYDLYNYRSQVGSLIPGKDFVALVTSTATIPRLITQNTYMVLKK